MPAAAEEDRQQDRTGRTRSVLSERIGKELDALAGRLARGPWAGAAARPAGAARIEARIRWFGQLLAGLGEAGELYLDPRAIGFGSTVIARDLDTGDRLSFTVMTGASMAVVADEVAMESPIGEALVGRRPGDTITVTTPAGSRRYRIDSVRTLLERFGLRGPADAGAGGVPGPAPPVSGSGSS